MKSAYCTFLSTDSTLRYLTKQLHDFKDCKISHQKTGCKDNPYFKNTHNKKEIIQNEWI
jgi:hypothetical protein